MIVTIAGCGALGSLLAARMIEGGIRVQAFQRRGSHFDALNKNGIVVESGWPDSSGTYPLEVVSDDPARLLPSELIIVLVKSYSTAQVLPVREILEEDGVVLTLQNGLGNAETLIGMFGPNRVAAGVATYGANRVAPGVIRWGGDGSITLGPWLRCNDLSRAAAPFEQAALSVDYVEDPRPAIWKKLVINAMVNPTSALTGMMNGELAGNALSLALMRELAQEAVQAAYSAGVDLDFEELWPQHLAHLERTAGARPSMLQDLEARRQTEIDAISGSVLQYARDAREFPYTRALYALLKAIDTQRG